MVQQELNSTLERHFNDGLDVSDIAFNNEIQVKPAAGRIGTLIVRGSLEELDNRAPGTLEVRSLGSILDSINSGSESPQGTTGTGLHIGKAFNRYKN
jgi:hypothetical protein